MRLLHVYYALSTPTMRLLCACPAPIIPCSACSTPTMCVRYASVQMYRFWCLALVALILRFAAADPGSVLCPCLSSAGVGGLSFDRAVPSGYGVSCVAHDLGFLAECTDNRSLAAYCESQWCYVDPNNCTVEHSRSSYSDGWYSYATCGFRDEWESALAQKAFAGRTLTAVLIGNTGGWMGSYCTNKSGLIGGLSECQGPLLDFMTDLQAAAGYQVRSPTGGPVCGCGRCCMAPPVGACVSDFRLVWRCRSALMNYGNARGEGGGGGPPKN